MNASPLLVWGQVLAVGSLLNFLRLFADFLVEECRQLHHLCALDSDAAAIEALVYTDWVLGQFFTSQNLLQGFVRLERVLSTHLSLIRMDLLSGRFIYF